MSQEYVEVTVTAERGIYYGAVIQNPDPTKPPIDLRRLYERGEVLNIRKEDFVDFDELNRKRNQARGHEIEVSFRPTGKKLDAVAQAAAAGVDVEAIRKQLREEMAGEVREMVKIQFEQQALARQGMPPVGKGK